MKTEAPKTTLFNWQVEIWPRNTNREDTHWIEPVMATSKQEAINKAITNYPGHAWGNVEQLEGHLPEEEPERERYAEADELGTFRIWVWRDVAGTADWQLMGSANSRGMAEAIADSWKSSAELVRVDKVVSEWSREDEKLRELKRMLGEMAGAASTCWTSVGTAGVFDDQRASQVVDIALAGILAAYDITPKQ